MNDQAWTIAFLIWWRSLVAYAVLTLPCLMLPPVYFISLCFALAGSIIGLLVLVGLQSLLRHVLQRQGLLQYRTTILLIGIAGGCLSMYPALIAGEHLFELRTTIELRLLAYGVAGICPVIGFLFSLRRIRPFTQSEPA